VSTFKSWVTFGRRWIDLTLLLLYSVVSPATQPGAAHLVGDFAVAGTSLLAAAAVVLLAGKFVVAGAATPVAATHSVGFHLGAPSGVVDSVCNNDMNALKELFSQGNCIKLMGISDL
jgi:hypothetical protein